MAVVIQIVLEHFVVANGVNGFDDDPALLVHQAALAAAVEKRGADLFLDQ